MSTNKTKNYQLHSWAAQDDFLRSEFNDNFTKLDTALHSGLTAQTAALQNLLVVGSYTGDGTDNRKINLGFTPRMVLVISENADMHIGAYYYGGLALKGQKSTAVTIVDGGFSVRYFDAGSSMYFSNGNRYKYYYVALR